MKTKFFAFSFIFAAAISSAIVVLFSALSPKAFADEEKSESPYFLIVSDSGKVESFPLTSTEVDAKIDGVIADVTVRQTYKNDGDVPIEAIYVFPASTRAAVYGMKMTIGDRTIVAEIQEKTQARQTYEEAKEQGKSASLLEMDKPNLFKMNVANIMPGDVIQTELRYTELMIPEEGVYEFVYPTTVGPRYVSESDDSSSAATNSSIPYVFDKAFDFSMDVDLRTGVPLQTVECSSHQIEKPVKTETGMKIKLSEAEENPANRDFILKYTLRGDKIETGLLLSENGEENFFLLMLQPPKRVQASMIPPREYIFVMDVSGSMGGAPLETSKKMMRNLLEKLRPTDKFNVLFFAGGSDLLFGESVEATTTNIDEAFSRIDSRSGGGGTELLKALERVFAVPKAPGLSRTIAVLTDGYVGVEKQTITTIRNNLDKGNVFAFGIGSGVNRYIIEGIARAGLGEPFVVELSAGSVEANEIADRFVEYVRSPIMTDIDVDFGDFSVYDVEPVKVPDVAADRPILIYGKWKGEPKGEIHVKGIVGDRELNAYVPLKIFATEDASQALKYLWARKRLELISDYAAMDYADDARDEIIELGLNYNLLTKHTSFVAVDSEVRNDSVSTTVIQPNVMPDESLGESINSLVGISSGQGAAGSGFNIRGARTSAAKFSLHSIQAAPPNTEGDASLEPDGYSDAKEIHEEVQVTEDRYYPQGTIPKYRIKFYEKSKESEAREIYFDSTSFYTHGAFGEYVPIYSAKLSGLAWPQKIRENGEVLIEFKIEEEGKIASYEVLDSSDRAFKKTVDEYFRNKDLRVAISGLEEKFPDGVYRVKFIFVY